MVGVCIIVIMTQKDTKPTSPDFKAADNKTTTTHAASRGKNTTATQQADNNTTATDKTTGGKNRTSTSTSTSTAHDKDTPVNDSDKQYIDDLLEKTPVLRGFLGDNPTMVEVTEVLVRLYQRGTEKPKRGAEKNIIMSTQVPVVIKKIVEAIVDDDNNTWVSQKSIIVDAMVTWMQNHMDIIPDGDLKDEFTAKYMDTPDEIDRFLDTITRR